MALTQAARVARPRWWPAGPTSPCGPPTPQPRAGHGERGHSRGGAGRPPAPPPGGLAGGGGGAVGGRGAGGPRRGARSVPGAGVPGGYPSYGPLARPGSLPAADWVAIYEQHGGIPTVACLGFVLLLTPTGSPAAVRRAGQLHWRHHRRGRRPGPPRHRVVNRTA